MIFDLLTIQENIKINFKIFLFNLKTMLEKDFIIFIIFS